jgi:3-hydroxyisobutyrate dehydrogenase
MAEIGFIGVGNMGGPMVKNLVEAGHTVTAFDLSAAALDAVRDAGAATAATVAATAAGRDVVITMLPAGAQVREVYLGDAGVLAVATPTALLIDCSTIDVDTARAVAATAAESGRPLLDAPVSGGVAGAAAGTLTFMVGGEADAVARAEPVLGAMGKAVIHAGASGAGQAAKVCNNLILAVSMIGVSEAFGLADRLGLDRQTLFDIVSKATGQCWALTSYCPVPGPVPAAPSNRDYAPGFTAEMMLKDLRLAQGAAASANAATPLGAEAAALYALFCNAGNGGDDFSGIFKMIGGEDGD